ncbi:MAG: hypothetical protein Q8R02_00705 [Hyphomonadaceae bacterium]|nr:hypothetical protein [Hyphomonadaceae bacterium]
MFAGHYAAAIAAKAAEPKAPMWTLVAGAQLIDIGWSIFIATGIERASSDPSLEGSTLVLGYMPWTHSLPGVIAWSLAAAILAKYLLRFSTRVAIVIGAVVFSHWLLDLLVHRPDLEVYPGGPALGFGLWNFPVPEQAVEIGLLAITGIFWGSTRKALGQSAWPAALFMSFLVAIQIIAMLSPMPPGPLGVQQGLTVLAVYLVAALAALPLDGKRANSPQA